MITYPRFAHPEHPELFCQPILVSKPTNGAKPIVTLHLHYPRPIHGEVMTHKKFGRNARSSRAVPVRKMLEEVRTTPYVPWHWGANQKGMQAGAECNEPIILPYVRSGGMTHASSPMSWSREEAWLLQRDQAADLAEAYMNAGYHKQNPNRLLEPFAWIDTLITTTSLANFIHLRDHKDAEPHFQDLARLVVEARDWIKKEGVFQTLEPGEWHLPYFQGVPDYQPAIDYLRNKIGVMPTDERLLEVYKKISAARCARISYEPFDGDGSFEREMERFEHLVSSDRIHASPMEHQAAPDAEIPGYDDAWANEHLAGNLGPGWVQFRKTIPGEYIEDEDWL